MGPDFKNTPVLKRQNEVLLEKKFEHIFKEIYKDCSELFNQSNFKF